MPPATSRRAGPMKASAVLLACLIALAGSAGAVSANPRERESVHPSWSRHFQHEEEYGWRRTQERHDYKRQFTSGGCTVTRLWDGQEYTQKIECKPGRLPKPYVFRPY